MVECDGSPRGFDLEEDAEDDDIATPTQQKENHNPKSRPLSPTTIYRQGGPRPPELKRDRRKRRNDGFVEFNKRKQLRIIKGEVPADEVYIGDLAMNDRYVLLLLGEDAKRADWVVILDKLGIISSALKMRQTWSMTT